MIAMSYHRTYGMDIRITRCCNNFGIGQHIEKLIPIISVKQKVRKLNSFKPNLNANNRNYDNYYNRQRIILKYNKEK